MKHKRTAGTQTGATVAVLLLAGVGAFEISRDQSRATAPASSTFVQAAEQWLGPNLQTGSRLITDAQVRADLIEAQWPSSSIATASAAASDWRGYNFVVATPSLRAKPSALATAALASSTVVASFGSGPQSTQILRIDPAGIAAADAADNAAVSESTRAAAALSKNPRIQLEAEAGIQAGEGDADPRLLAMLVALSAQHPISVLRFTNTATDGTVHGLLHSFTLDTIDGVPVTQSGPQTMDVGTWLTAQHSPNEFITFGIDGDGNLLVAVAFTPLAPTP